MSKRSPVLGYNHNFKHRGLVFHVQTEDSGVDNPHLFTHCFHGGVIISSRKIDYDAASAEDVVKSLMQSQHKAVLKDLKIGALDDKIDAYLGDKEDLLPRKADSVAGPAPAASATADTEPTTPTPPEDVATADTEPVTPAPPEDVPAGIAAAPQAPPPVAPPDLAHSAAISLNTPSTPIPQIVAEAPKTEPNPSDYAPGEETHRHREHIPTPVSMPAVQPDNLGEPIVTFNKPGESSAPQAAAPHFIPHDSVGERSATYSIQRPGRRNRPATQPRHVPSGPRTPQPPARTPGGRPSGKAANPQPGMRRSSVVVSRPAVIVGAPARSVGGDSGRRAKRRTPAARRSRNKDLFGNDTVSEKSLDEVIMAYLSEDNGEE